MSDEVIIERFARACGWWETLEETGGSPPGLVAGWVGAVALAVHAEAKAEVGEKGRVWRATARWMHKARHDEVLATKFRVMVGLGGGQAVVRWAVTAEGGGAGGAGGAPRRLHPSAPPPPSGIKTEWRRAMKTKATMTMLVALALLGCSAQVTHDGGGGQPPAQGGAGGADLGPGGAGGDGGAGGQAECTPGEVCRGVAGVCDVAEVCGEDGVCPRDSPQAYGTQPQAPGCGLYACNGHDTGCPPSTCTLGAWCDAGACLACPAVTVVECWEDADCGPPGCAVCDNFPGAGEPGGCFPCPGPFCDGW